MNKAAQVLQRRVAAACNCGEETRGKWKTKMGGRSRKSQLKKENNGEGEDLANKAEKLEIPAREMKQRIPPSSLQKSG